MLRALIPVCAVLVTLEAVQAQGFLGNSLPNGLAPQGARMMPVTRPAPPGQGRQFVPYGPMGPLGPLGAMPAPPPSFSGGGPAGTLNMGALSLFDATSPGAAPGGSGSGRELTKWNLKMRFLRGIPSIYEQQGCVNPVTALTPNTQSFMASVFANGCRAPNANDTCRLIQYRTTGMRSLIQANMFPPAQKQQIAAMLHQMTPWGMMETMQRQQQAAQTRNGAAAGGAVGFGGPDMMFPMLMGGEGGMAGEMSESLGQMRKNLFPLECQEVGPKSLFGGMSVGFCCPGPVVIPDMYQMTGLTRGA